MSDTSVVVVETDGSTTVLDLGTTLSVIDVDSLDAVTVVDVGSPVGPPGPPGPSGPYVDVSAEYGAACDGTTDDTAAWQAAIAAVGATGGTLTWTGNSRITDRLVISTGNLSIIGAGGGLGATPTYHGSMLFLDSVDAGITLANPLASGGKFSHFSLWNNGHALTSMFELEVVACVELSHLYFEGSNTALIGLKAWGTQNCWYNHLAICRCDTNIDMNNGAWMNLFTRIDSENAKQWHVRLTDEVGENGYGPSFNTFERCIFEYGATTGGGSQGVVWASSGIDNVFRDCLLTAPAATASADALVKVDVASTYHDAGTRLVFDSSSLQGTGAQVGFKQAASTELVFYGHNALTLLSAGWQHNGGTGWMQFPFRDAGVTTLFTGSALSSLWLNVTTPFGRPLDGVLDDSDLFMLRWRRRSEPFPRFHITSHGSIEMGDGTTGNPDVTLIRFSPNLLQMGGGDSFMVDGVWNAGTLRVGADQMWVDAAGALRVKSGAPSSDTDGTNLMRRPVKADTTTAYTPILTDENQMITLSNAAAITVTLPQNSAVAFPIGAEIDFLWLGVGQPTFAAGTGATVNGTPGLKLRAQSSAATAKKISTNGWVVIGDLSA